MRAESNWYFCLNLLEVGPHNERHWKKKSFMNMCENREIKPSVTYVIAFCLQNKIKTRFVWVRVMSRGCKSVIWTHCFCREMEWNVILLWEGPQTHHRHQKPFPALRGAGRGAQRRLCYILGENGYLSAKTRKKWPRSQQHVAATKPEERTLGVLELKWILAPEPKWWQHKRKIRDSIY